MAEVALARWSRLPTPFFLANRKNLSLTEHCKVNMVNFLCTNFSSDGSLFGHLEEFASPAPRRPFPSPSSPCLASPAFLKMAVYAVLPCDLLEFENLIMVLCLRLHFGVIGLLVLESQDGPSNQEHHRLQNCQRLRCLDPRVQYTVHCGPASGKEGCLLDYIVRD